MSHIIDDPADLTPEGRRLIFELVVHSGRELRRRREAMNANSLRVGFLNADCESFIECGPDGRITLDGEDVTEVVDMGVEAAMARIPPPE